MSRILKFTAYFVLSVIILFGLFLLVFTLTDYQPAERIIIYESAHPDTLRANHYLALSWNIGYAGLDQDMDFFYDGGTQVRTYREQTEQNLRYIENFLATRDSVDFIFLQEVDINSRRTYRFNEFNSINNVLGQHKGWFTPNYKVGFVPLPITQPMGKVNSGLAFFSRYEPSLVERFDYPGKYSWPTRIFMLDRGFLVAHFPLSSGKELLVINSHNSAFDNGTLKEQEMQYLREYLLKQHQAGYKIVVGADWNQNPPGIDASHFSTPPAFDKFILKSINPDFLPADWTWCYDPRIPTNRDLRQPYREGETFTTIIDFFLLSPGLSLLKVETTDMKFRHSDHQPVLLSFGLSDN